MSKFKVGDRVRLVQDLGFNFDEIGLRVGDEGTVVDGPDFVVQTENEGALYFQEEELEAI